MKKLTIFLLTAALLWGCAAAPAAPGEPVNLMEEVPARIICLAEEPDCGVSAADNAIVLFQNTHVDGANTLVSPLSVLAALGMTANGAEGQTLTQMENALGMTSQDINGYLYSLMEGQGEALKLANAIWLLDDPSLTVEQSFLETNADYYQADVFKAPMDGGTLDAINGWVSRKTDGMIPKLLDQIPEDAVMYLINALAFEAEWESTYAPYQVQEETFTTEDGGGRLVEMMRSTESRYLEDDLATGFIKYYKDRGYAFVALLPKEGVTVSEYAASLTGQSLQELLDHPEETVVYAAMPKFEVEFDADLAEALKTMGMTDAFDDDLADFSRLGHSENGNLFISRILHKTRIQVAEEGTRAAAATSVEMVCGSAFIPDFREVTLDRPFLYMLIDCERNYPIFIGAMMDPGGDVCGAPLAPTEEAETVAPYLSGLTVGGLEAHIGSYRWEMDNGDGTVSAVNVDAAHPLEMIRNLPSLETDQEVLELEFFDMPDSVSALCWPDGSTREEQAEVSLTGLTLKPGAYTYQITAEWEDGSVSYSFHATLTE